MNITTKFKVGDTVFTIDPDTLKIKKYEVESVNTYTNADGTHASIYPKGETSYKSIDESKCFSTREELIDHVTKP